MGIESDAHWYELEFDPWPCQFLYRVLPVAFRCSRQRVLPGQMVYNLKRRPHLVCLLMGTGSTGIGIQPFSFWFARMVFWCVFGYLQVNGIP